MEPMTAGALITGASSLLGTAVDAGVNYKIAKMNLDFQKDVYDWQKNVQQQTWNREDNAVRRRMADLKSAGMNPLLAAGGAASSGQAVSVTAPQNNYRSEIGAQMLATAKAMTDISMTRSQQQLLNQQVQQQKTANDLAKLTLKWYKDHPNTAPGVDTTKSVGGLVGDVFRGASDVGSAIGSRIGAVLGHRGYKPVTFDNAFRFYKTQGMSDTQATSAARRAVDRGIQQTRR